MTKEPKEWTFCPVCDLRYGFINCRVTISKGGVTRNLCLTCAVAEDKLKKNENDTTTLR